MIDSLLVLVFSYVYNTKQKASHQMSLITHYLGKKHPPCLCISEPLCVSVRLSCNTHWNRFPFSQRLSRSLGRLAVLWVMCLRWGLRPSALQHSYINSADSFICLGTPYCTVCGSGSTRVCLPCVSVRELACTCIHERFAAALGAICLSPSGLQYMLLVSIKYLSRADCPPVCRLYIVHLYAAWDHFGNGQPFHVDQLWQA